MVIAAEHLTRSVDRGEQGMRHLVAALVLACEASDFDCDLEVGAVDLALWASGL